MKRKFVTLIIVLLAVVMGCEKQEKEPEKPQPPVTEQEPKEETEQEEKAEPKEQEPQNPKSQDGDLPFTEYSLTGKSNEEISARWVINVDYGDDDEILIINSDEEFKKYVEGNYPRIDFYKKTILVAYGYTPTEFRKSEVNNFSQMSNSEYQLDVTVLLKDTTKPDRWIAAIVIDKIESDSKFIINVKIPNVWPE